MTDQTPQNTEIDRIGDRCPLSKASCDPLANGCDGECESEWASYACTGGRHEQCDGLAWKPGINCECPCHAPAGSCPCDCPPDMHIGDIGCPCALPGEPPCLLTPPTGGD